MLRRQLFVNSIPRVGGFVLSSSSLLSSLTRHKSILPDQEEGNEEVNKNTDQQQKQQSSFSLSRHQILGQRWGCAGFASTEANNNNNNSDAVASSSPESKLTNKQKKSSSNTPSSTKNESGVAAAGAASSESTTSIFSSALRGFVRKITRRDEFEEEEEIRKVAQYHKQQQREKMMQQSSGGRGSKTTNNDNNINNTKTLEELKIDRSPDIEAIDNFGELSWGVYERLDVSVRWAAPIDWNVHTRVSENFVAIQCVPPPPELEMDEGEFESNNNNNKSSTDPQQTSSSSSSSSSSQQQQQPSIHGLSVSNFVYLSKVPPHVSANDLLKQFLNQFHRSVGRTSVVVGSSTFTEDQISPANKESCEMCRELVELSGFDMSESDNNSTGSDEKKLKTDKNGKPIPKIPCAVCELVFRPPATSSSSQNNTNNNNSNNNSPSSSLKENSQQQNQHSARALCKVFFHRSRKRHTVVVFAVPDEEWGQVKDLVKHAILCVSELQHHSTGRVDY